MKQQKNTSEKEKRCKNLKRSRARGIEYVQRIVKELKNLGFDVVTSRSESKQMDDKKIDIIDKNGMLPYLQLKRTIKTPDYFAIKKECPLTDKPFCIIWNKQVSTEKTFRSAGELVMLDKNFFYQLLIKYYDM